MSELKTAAHQTHLREDWKYVYTDQDAHAHNTKRELIRLICKYVVSGDGNLYRPFELKPPVFKGNLFRMWSTYRPSLFGSPEYEVAASIEQDAPVERFEEAESIIPIEPTQLELPLESTSLLKLSTGERYKSPIVKQVIYKYRKGMLIMENLSQKEDELDNIPLKVESVKKPVLKEVKPPSKGRFVIQSHRTLRSKGREHFDFRLEWPRATSEEYINKRQFDITPEPTSDDEEEFDLRSWAIPKAKLPSVNARLLAIETERHPIDYLSFKGSIPKGLYGAGDVSIYDTGSYTLLDESVHKLVFVLNGTQVKGEYALINKQANQWLFIKLEGGDK